MALSIHDYLTNDWRDTGWHETSSTAGRTVNTACTPPRRQRKASRSNETTRGDDDLPRTRIGDQPRTARPAPASTTGPARPSPQQPGADLRCSDAPESFAGFDHARPACRTLIHDECNEMRNDTRPLVTLRPPRGPLFSRGIRRCPYASGGGSVPPRRGCMMGADRSWQAGVDPRPGTTGFTTVSRADPPWHRSVETTAGVADERGSRPW